MLDTRKQLLPFQPFLLLYRPVEDTEEVILSDDSDQDPDFVPVERRSTSSSEFPPLFKAAQKPKIKSADPTATVPSNPFKVAATNERGEEVDPLPLREVVRYLARQGKDHHDCVWC